MDAWWKQSITIPIIRKFGQQRIKNKFKAGPIFIGGCGRSGTSLLLSILSAHPKIYALSKESDAFTKWTRDDNGKVIPERIDRFYRQMLKTTIPSSCDRWCEKRPSNVNYITQILEYFGEKARFIHIVRDPRAVCTSYHPSRKNEYWISLDRYENDVNNGLKFQNHPQVYTIKYEDLVINSESSIQSLCDFLDLEYGKEMKNWFEYAKIRKSKAWYGELLDTHTHSIHKWQKPEHEDRIEEILSHEGVMRIAKKVGYSFQKIKLEN